MKRLLARLDRVDLRWELGFALLVLFSVVPLWVVRHPPLQDLPQHLAAMRVLHDYHDPALRFDQYFDRALGSTQYLAYYLVVHVLAYVAGVPLANKLVLTLCVAAAPYAMRSLLRALERDEAHALLLLPLTYNAHLILGFFNFVAGIPLLLWGLALAVRQRRKPCRRRAWLLAGVLLIAFFTHVVPAALLFVGAFSVLVQWGAAPAARALWPLAPTALTAAIWTRTTPAGRAVVAAAGGERSGVAPQFEPWGQALRQVPDWLTDVLQVPLDDELLVGWLVLVLVVLLFGSVRPAPRERAPLVTSLTLRVAALCPLAALAYFVTPSAYAWIWPINARFPLLALILLLAVLPDLPALARRATGLAAVILAAVSFNAVATAFRGFERDELAGFERASAAIPEGSRVAGLIWDRGSRHVKFSPLIHAAALHQAARGGAVMFSFADFPQSPVVFKPDNRPPRVPPRWEWLPQNVDPDRQLGWYDYVLVRGGPGRIERSRRWQLVLSDRGWAVYRRVQPPM